MTSFVQNSSPWHGERIHEMVWRTMRRMPSDTYAKIWASLLARPAPYRVTHIRLSGSEVFADQTVELTKAFMGYWTGVVVHD